MCRVVHRPLRQQRLELDPQRFGKPGWQGRHGRSSFSITKRRQLRDLEAPCLPLRSGQISRPIRATSKAEGLSRAPGGPGVTPSGQFAADAVRVLRPDPGGVGTATGRAVEHDREVSWRSVGQLRQRVLTGDRRSPRRSRRSLPVPPTRGSASRSGGHSLAGCRHSPRPPGGRRCHGLGSGARCPVHDCPSSRHGSHATPMGRRDLRSRM